MGSRLCASMGGQGGPWAQSVCANRFCLKKKEAPSGRIMLSSWMLRYRWQEVCFRGFLLEIHSFFFFLGD